MYILKIFENIAGQLLNKVPYIRLCTRHVLSKNSSLKLCIFPGIQVRALMFFICKNVQNLRDCIFQDFDDLKNIAEIGCTWKKTHTRYHR